MRHFLRDKVRVGVGLFLAGLLAVCSYWVWQMSFADRNRGASQVDASAAKPHGEGVGETPRADWATALGRVRELLQAQPGVTIGDWRTGALGSINGTNRYFALLDVHDAERGIAFGLGLEWQGERWVLRTESPLLPEYVRRVVEASGEMRTPTRKEKAGK